MIPYILIIFLACGTAYVGRKSQSAAFERLCIWSVGIILILFAGLRSYRVGTDTGNYVRIWTYSQSLSEALSSQMEIGYLILMWVTRNLSDNYAVLLTAIAIIVVTLYLSTIVKLVDRYEFGVYVFIALNSYAGFFNGARQAIAVAICFFALRFLLDKRFVPYIACIAIAMVFHKTALVALPLYFLATSEIKLKRLLGLLATVIVLTGFIRLFVGLASEFLDDRFANYATQGEVGGAVVTFTLAIQVGILFWFRKRVVDDRDRYMRLLNVYLISLVPALVTVFAGIDPSGIMRLTAYFTGAEILLWPMVFQQVRRTRQAQLIGFSFLLITMMYFIIFTRAFSGMTPYELNTGLW